VCCWGWAVTEDTYQRASAALGVEDLLVDGGDGKKQNLNLTICANALRSMARRAELLGFSPVSRTRLAVSAGKGPALDEYDYDEHGKPRPTLEEWLEKGRQLDEKLKREFAERDAQTRPSVVFRKVTNGFRCEWGRSLRRLPLRHQHRKGQSRFRPCSHPVRVGRKTTRAAARQDGVSNYDQCRRIRAPAHRKR
jgi:hypothetical protein